MLDIYITKKSTEYTELMFDDDNTIYTVLLTKRKREQLINKLKECEE